MQFDLRFYVVALVFIVFEVEVALFFPPAMIFGTATRWMNSQATPRRSAAWKPTWGCRASQGSRDEWSACRGMRKAATSPQEIAAAR